MEEESVYRIPEEFIVEVFEKLAVYNYNGEKFIIKASHNNQHGTKGEGKFMLNVNYSYIIYFNISTIYKIHPDDRIYFIKFFREEGYEPMDQFILYEADVLSIKREIELIKLGI